MRASTAHAGRYPAKLLAITVFMVFAGSVSAWAHYVYQYGEAWNNGNYCLDGRSEISHGIGYGYSKSNGYAYKPGTDINGTLRPCYAPWSVAPNYLSAKNYLQKKNSSGAWVYCNEDGTRFNTTTSYTVMNNEYWQSAGTTKWCGPGTYRTRAYISVIFDGVRRYGNVYSNPGHAL